ncbi:MAG: hypothetical protein J7J70_01950 [Deltaproteobacteria bacterium]|nr:hypothetical protein [Candidatus Tharpellaceae bacterium]
MNRNNSLTQLDDYHENDGVVLQPDEYPSEKKGKGKGKGKGKKEDSWKHKLPLKDILSNISSVHSLYTDYVDTIKNYKVAMEADYRIGSGEGKSKVTPKAIQKLHNYAYSALSEGLLSDYNIVSASPNGHTDLVESQAQSLLLNYQLNEEMDFESVVDKAARYFEDYGSFYLKLSWNYKERKKKNHKPTLKQLPEGVPPEQMQQLFEQGLLTEDGMLIVDKEITSVVQDHPVISIKKYNQVILGPSLDGSNTIDSLQFIADKYYATVANLEASGKYHNLDRIVDRELKSDYDINALPDADFELEFEAMMEDNGEELERKTVDKNKPLVVTDYWTMMPIKDKGHPVPIVVTFVAGVVIAREESTYGVDVGYPYARGLYAQSLEDDLYDGIPDTPELEEDQKIIGAVTRGMIDIMAKAANGQTGMAQGMLDPAEERKRQAGQDYKFNPAIDPTRGIVQEKFPELPQSALQMLQMMQGSMESASGKKMFGEGLNSGAYGDVAKGIDSVVNTTTQRTMSNVRKFNKPFVAIIKKMAQLNREFITDDKVIALSDNEFKTIRPNELQSSINVKILVSTPELDDRAANDLGFLVQTLGDSVPPKAKNMMLSDIARLKKRPDLAKMLLDIPDPQPSPEEIELHQLNVELLKAQIANENAKGVENLADETLKNAKAETEVAKTKVLYSTADNQDLDFLHKRDGTELQREKELEDAKHVNNVESEMFRGAFNNVEGENDNGLTKVPNNTMNDAQIPVIDLPQELLQPSDLY